VRKCGGRFGTSGKKKKERWNGGEGRKEGREERRKRREGNGGEGRAVTEGRQAGRKQGRKEGRKEGRISQPNTNNKKYNNNNNNNVKTDRGKVGEGR
jgi:hypothetical protein